MKSAGTKDAISSSRPARRRQKSATRRIDIPLRALLRQRRVQLAILVGAAVVTLVVWKGSQRVATGPAEGTALHQPAPVSEPVEPASSPANDGRGFLVSTYNIHGGRGTDRVRDLSRIADNVRGAELIGLNEVHQLWPLGRNQAEWLGDELQLAWLFAPTEQKWWYHDFGNALLTSLPVSHWQRIPLSRSYGKSFRNVVLASVVYKGRTVQVLITHIDRSDDRERAAQVRAVADLFSSLAEPAILMGDMNSDAADPPIARLLAMPGVDVPLDRALGEGAPRTIDWIFTRGLTTLDAGLEQSVASDHPRVWARLELPERSGTVTYSPR